MATPQYEDDPGRQASKVSEFVVQTLVALTGKGPGRIRTSLASDVVTVVLEDVMGKGELALTAGGHSDQVLGGRRAYQAVMGPDLIAGISAITGRTVIAYMSANHLEPDLAVEVFVLESLRDDDA